MTETHPDALVQIYGIVEQLLEAYDRSPAFQTISPYITLLRHWRDAVNQILDATDDDHLPGDGVSMPL